MPKTILFAMLTLALGCSPAPGDSASETATSDGSTASETDAETATETDTAGIDGAWVDGEPEDHGIDPHALEALHDYAFRPEFNTQSVLVIRDGRMIAEWYAPDRGPEDWATSWSMAKSFSSTLLGIAMHEGLLTSLDEPMTTYIPEWTGSGREAITLRHVLSMSTGFEWGESRDDLTDLLEMAVRGDQLAFALEQELVDAPGEVWNYSSGTSMLLSRVIEEVTGMQAEQYAQLKLAEPLGFDRYEWWVDGAGSTLTYCCLDATSRDFARLGQLYLQGGVWNGETLLDPSWVDLVATAHQPDNPSYGLQFWLNQAGGEPDRPTVSRKLVAAQGHDHQFIFIFPETNMVAVRNAYFIRPEGEPVASEGLAQAGMGLEGLAPTGTFAPDPSWDDTTFLELIEATVID